MRLRPYRNLISWSEPGRAWSDRTIRVVLAKAEYEAWFLAAAASIGG